MTRTQSRPPVRRASRPTRRRQTRGQAMIEFAFCAPVVFAILFGVINGGLFMYARNTVSRAETVGVITEAAEGIGDTADVDTLAAMRNTGLSTSSLAAVQYVNIEEVTPSGSGFSPVNGCSDASGSVPCADKYKIDGTPMWSVPGGCADTVNHCAPWPPSARSIHFASAAQPLTYIRLTIHYTFTFLGLKASPFTLDEVQIFRLEPKDL